MTGKIAVVGDKDSILAFKAVGAETFTAANAFELNDLMKRFVKEEYAVVFITEELAQMIEETLSRLKTRPYPAVIPIPSQLGSNGLGLRGIKKDVEKAIGADILFGQD